MGGLALFETQATRLPSCVNAAPPGLWTSAAHRVQSACWALSETIDVSNPAGSRRTCSSRPPSASKRLTRWLLPRKPLPRCASSISSPQSPGSGTVGALVLLLWCVPVDF